MESTENALNQILGQNDILQTQLPSITKNLDQTFVTNQQNIYQNTFLSFPNKLPEQPFGVPKPPEKERIQKTQQLSTFANNIRIGLQKDKDRFNLNNLEASLQTIQNNSSTFKDHISKKLQQIKEIKDNKQQLTNKQLYTKKSNIFEQIQKETVNYQLYDDIKQFIRPIESVENEKYFQCRLCLEFPFEMIPKCIKELQDHLEKSHKMKCCQDLDFQNEIELLFQKKQIIEKSEYFNKYIKLENIDNNKFSICKICIKSQQNPKTHVFLVHNKIYLEQNEEIDQDQDQDRFTEDENSSEESEPKKIASNKNNSIIMFFTLQKIFSKHQIIHTRFSFDKIKSSKKHNRDSCRNCGNCKNIKQKRNKKCRISSDQISQTDYLDRVDEMKRKYCQVDYGRKTPYWGQRQINNFDQQNWGQRSGISPRNSENYEYKQSQKQNTFLQLMSQKQTERESQNQTFFLKTIDKILQTKKPKAQLKQTNNLFDCTIIPVSQQQKFEKQISTQLTDFQAKIKDLQNQINYQAHKPIIQSQNKSSDIFLINNTNQKPKQKKPKINSTFQVRKQKLLTAEKNDFATFENDTPNQPLQTQISTDDFNFNDQGKPLKCTQNSRYSTTCMNQQFELELQNEASIIQISENCFPLKPVNQLPQKDSVKPYY